MQSSRPSAGTNVRILFADDSKLIRFAGKRFLDQSFDVVLATDGREAWQQLAQDRTIGAIVTDLNMPHMDGVELIRRVRGAADTRLRGLPILVVTGVDETASRWRALDAGATEIVPKPFSSSDLITPLRHYLRAAGEPERSAGPLPNVEQTPGGLINRLEQALAFHSRHALEFSLLHVRLDNHLRIARDCGGNWAESVMRHLERSLARAVRLEDTVGRSDQSTFSVVLTNTPVAGARRLAERLRARLAHATVRFPGRSLRLVLSISVQDAWSGQAQSAAGMLHTGLLDLGMPANVTRLAHRHSA